MKIQGPLFCLGQRKNSAILLVLSLFSHSPSFSYSKGPRERHKQSLAQSVPHGVMALIYWKMNNAVFILILPHVWLFLDSLFPSSTLWFWLGNECWFEKWHDVIEFVLETALFPVVVLNMQTAKYGWSWLCTRGRDCWLITEICSFLLPRNMVHGYTF